MQVEAFHRRLNNLMDKVVDPEDDILVISPSGDVLIIEAVVYGSGTRLLEIRTSEPDSEEPDEETNKETNEGDDE